MFVVFTSKLHFVAIPLNIVAYDLSTQNLLLPKDLNVVSTSIFSQDTGRTRTYPGDIFRHLCGLYVNWFPVAYSVRAGFVWSAV